MEHYAGIDVSLELSSVCVVDAQGAILKEAKVASDPEALVAWFKAVGFPVTRMGLEAGRLSQWLHAGLEQAGFAVVCGGRSADHGRKHETGGDTSDQGIDFLQAHYGNRPDYRPNTHRGTGAPVDLRDLAIDLIGRAARIGHEALGLHRED